MKRDYSAVTPEVAALAELCCADDRIDPSLYVEHKVNRGLRDLNGNGVLTGLTEISEITAKKQVGAQSVPCAGELFYRGYDVRKLTSGFIADDRFGFEEIIYLLLFGSLPDKEALAAFQTLLGD